MQALNDCYRFAAFVYLVQRPIRDGHVFYAGSGQASWRFVLGPCSVVQEGSAVPVAGPGHDEALTVGQVAASQGAPTGRAAAVSEAGPAASEVARAVAVSEAGPVASMAGRAVAVSEAGPVASGRPGRWLFRRRPGRLPRGARWCLWWTRRPRGRGGWLWDWFRRGHLPSGS